MKSSKIKNQIEEDIRIIQDEYGKNYPALLKDEYAFNFWVLTKLYSVDEEIAMDNITDVHDDGCDCFVFFEEIKELYIIQNKYYNDDTPLDEKYCIKDFLNRPLDTLSEGIYKRSGELQTIFSKYKKDSEFKVYLNLYITNNNVSDSLKERFEKHTYSRPDKDVYCYVEANLYTIDDIGKLYSEERKKTTKNFECMFKSKNNGTVLHIRPKDYNLPNLTDAKYILTPVKLIYEIVKDANKVDYMLFEENIREYLGKKGINGKISQTLMSDDDRENFFYYNNGITIICDNVETVQIQSDDLSIGFRAYNPQIVNGCQTVNTIYETLNKYHETEIEEKFKNTFVMVKLLKLKKDEETNKALYQDIVRYNNSQNAINTKDFAANHKLFLNLQEDFKKHGFLLAVKQSDDYKFKTEENFNTYRPKIEIYNNLFNLEIATLDKIVIKLEKFLQIVMAFKFGGQDAFQKKSQLLKIDSPIYKSILEYIEDGPLTHQDLIDLYLLFLKAETDKQSSFDKRTPIPYYVLDFISRDLEGLEGDNYRRSFRYIFENQKNLNAIYTYYKKITSEYKYSHEEKSIEYNVMIKSPVDQDILNKSIARVRATADFSSEMWDIIEKFKSHS